MLRGLAITLFAAANLFAQIPVHPHVVLTRLPGGNPSAALVEVDPGTATAVQLGRFPHDNLPPLAIALDPFNRQVLVAVQLPNGTSRVLRIERSNAGLVEQTMCDVPGSVVGLWVQDDWLLVGNDQGVLRAPRRGGPAQPAFAVANLSAMHGYGPNGPSLTVAWNGRPASANPLPGIAYVDTYTGQPFLGPHTFSQPANVDLTGAVDLPTGVPRQLLSFSDGSFWLFAGLIGPPTPIPTSVPIPPGGAVALGRISEFGLWPLALGGAAFPYLYEVDFWSGIVTLRSPALPGDPVAFCNGGDRSARMYTFAEGCGLALFQLTHQGLPSPGVTLLFDAISLGSSPMRLLCLGLRDGPGLPLSLPGGCALHVSPDAPLLVPRSGSVALQIPPQAAYLGVNLFAQWLEPTTQGIATSNAVAFHIGL